MPPRPDSSPGPSPGSPPDAASHPILTRSAADRQEVEEEQSLSIGKISICPGLALPIRSAPGQDLMGSRRLTWGNWTLSIDRVGNGVSIALWGSQIQPKVLISLMRACPTYSCMGAGLLEDFRLAHLCADKFRGMSRSPLSCLCWTPPERRSEIRLRGHRKLLNENSHRL
jgi:hypothetical protein